MQAAFPCAHLQIHAHRDEFLFAMLRAQGESQLRGPRRLSATPRRRHPACPTCIFPWAGRMRPCVEDVLHMLVSEFGVRTEPGAQDVIDEGRARWRRRQIAASVRDAPAEVVRVLREEMGYTRGAGGRHVRRAPGPAHPLLTAQARDARSRSSSCARSAPKPRYSPSPT